MYAAGVKSVIIARLLVKSAPGRALNVLPIDQRCGRNCLRSGRDLRSEVTTVVSFDRCDGKLEMKHRGSVGGEGQGLLLGAESRSGHVTE